MDYDRKLNYRLRNENVCTIAIVCIMSPIRGTRLAVRASDRRSSSTHERLFPRGFLCAFGDNVGGEQNRAIDGDGKSTMSTSHHHGDLHSSENQHNARAARKSD